MWRDKFYIFKQVLYTASQVLYFVARFMYKLRYFTYLMINFIYDKRHSIISSAIWNKRARGNFFKDEKWRVQFVVFETKCECLFISNCTKENDVISYYQQT